MFYFNNACHKSSHPEFRHLAGFVVACLSFCVPGLAIAALQSMPPSVKIRCLGA